MLCYAMLCYAMRCDAMPLHATLVWSYSNRSMQCNAILWCVMLRYSVLPRYGLTATDRCNAMECYATSLFLSISPSLSHSPSYLSLTFVRSLTLKLLSCPSSLPTNSTELIEEGQHLFLNILYYLSQRKLLSYFVSCHIISCNLFFSFKSNQLIPFSST
jgi:hypothetical protein